MTTKNSDYEIIREDGMICVKDPRGIIRKICFSEDIANVLLEYVKNQDSGLSEERE